MSNVRVERKIVLISDGKVVSDEYFDKEHKVFDTNTKVLVRTTDVCETTIVLFDEENNEEKLRLDFVIQYQVIDKQKAIQVRTRSGNSIYSLEGEKIISDIVFKPEITFVIVEKNNKFGIYSYEGNEIIPTEYDHIAHKPECYIVKKGEKYGIISENGEKLLECEYDEIKHIVLEAFELKKDGEVMLYILPSRSIIEIDEYFYDKDKGILSYSSSGFWYELKNSELW